MSLNVKALWNNYRSNLRLFQRMPNCYGKREKHVWSHTEIAILVFVVTPMWHTPYIIEFPLELIITKFKNYDL